MRADPVEETLYSAQPDLLGHEDVESYLLQLMAQNRLPHALLLTGPKGIGKATMAHRLAQYLLTYSEDAGISHKTLHVDPASMVRRRILSGSHGDFLCISRGVDEKGKVQLEIPVGKVREIPAFLQKTSSESPYRVVVVDGVEEMNRNGANALLKSLEEPPLGTFIILVSHKPGLLLPTIRSRCQVIQMKPLSSEIVGDYLAKHHGSFSKEERDLLTSLSGGRLGQVLTMIQGGGLALYKEMLGAVKGLLTNSANVPFSLIERLCKKQESDSFEIFTILLMGFLGNYLKSEGKSACNTPEEVELYGLMTNHCSLENWLRIWEKIRLHFEEMQRYTLDRKQTLLCVFLSFVKER
ncbi:MAG: DNA polymerase III subunit delta' [Alphaproteobacteria bacterium]|jgi:DNA polymerase III subunit delta'|nr:DNA polymerase III subunit delta' [Alphaproteobacteria bacterium]MBT5389807.1 DNA polymerase III subunit delta' [Alphaproteobacteria bacterium]MBT5540219.1 DNA polymerase III subunit delta' [Alphaproteobacteria bacterium]MBT5654019.1 DNA polymerase III subunit delta' [Alphaproteobacteria bacterium]